MPELFWRQLYVHGPQQNEENGMAQLERDKRRAESGTRRE